METGKSLKRLSRGQRRAALVAVIVLACAGLWTLLPFLPALGWAIVFAVSMWPWYARLGERWPRHRGVLLPSLAVFFTLLLFVLPLIMIATALAQDTAALIQWQHQAALQGVPVPAMLPRLPYGQQLVAWWQANIAPPGALNHLPIFGLGGSTLDLGGRFLGAVLHRLLIIVFMLLRGYFSDIMGTQRAKAAFKQNLESATLNPADASAHYNLGLIHQSRGELDQARERFERALQIDEGEIDASYQLGRIARGQ